MISILLPDSLVIPRTAAASMAASELTGGLGGGKGGDGTGGGGGFGLGGVGEGAGLGGAGGGGEGAHTQFWALHLQLGACG